MIVATVAVTTRTETDRRLGGLERRPQNKITFSFSRGGCNEARAAGCGTLSQTVDYNIMQQQSKHFSFRKTFRKVFHTVEKDGQSIREW